MADVPLSRPARPAPDQGLGALGDSSLDDRVHSLDVQLADKRPTVR
jgi:hypothetical protein